jgi:hypothetical protein
MYATATGSSSVAKNLFIAGANPFFEILFTIELP